MAATPIVRSSSTFLPADNPWAPQAEIVIKALYNHDGPAAARQQEARAIYKGSGEAEVFDALPGEFAFTYKASGSRGVGPAHPEVMTALNGQGGDIAMIIKDEMLQQDALLDRIEIVGTVNNKYSEKQNNTGQGLAVTIGGLRNCTAGTDLPYGALVKVIPPPLSVLRDVTRKVKPGTPKSKATLMLVPIDSRSTGVKFVRHLNEFIDNEARYKMVFNKDARSVSRRVRAVATKQDTDLTRGIIFLEQLIKAKVIKNIQIEDTVADNMLAGGASQTEILLGIAQTLGVLGQEPVHLDNVAISPQTQVRMSHIRKEILKAMYWDARVSNHGFGFDDANGTSPGFDSQTGNMKANAAGRMLTKQFNATQMEIASLQDFIIQECRTFEGKVVKPQSAGGGTAIV
jgi:hypothetical protein